MQQTGMSKVTKVERQFEENGFQAADTSLNN